MVPADGFQDDHIFPVHDEKGIHVGEALVPVAAGPSLAMPAEEADDHVEGFPGGAPPLESEPEEIHPDEPGLPFGSDLREQGLVADDDALFVYPHLGAPDPEGLAQEHGMRFTHLGNGDVGARKIFARGMLTPGQRDHDLRLVGLPVRGLAVPFLDRDGAVV